MQTAQLGPVAVSRLGLGAVRMGGTTSRAEAHRMLDRFLEAGGTLIDTADTSLDGGSEETLAPWLASRHDEVVVATKVRFEVSDPGGEGLSPERIRKACEASLRRLGWAVAIQDREGWSPFISLQPQYSLVERSIELELLPFCRAAGPGVLPWGPLGAGFLTGRYRPGQPPPVGSRMANAGDDWEEAPHRRGVERNHRVVAEASAIAHARGATVAQVALAWLLGTEGVTAPIVGPRTLEQLDGLLGATELSLSAEERARLEAHAPPPALYPQRMLREQAGIGDPAELRRPGSDALPAG
jgi:aryl-alcohol dehydrogenase-like predicted oxidoreductase